MKRVALASVLAFVAAQTMAVDLYRQDPLAGGPLVLSSWLNYNEQGSDADMYSYDAFILSGDASVSEVAWQGGYEHGGLYGGQVNTFTIAFYNNSSYPGVHEPACGNPQVQDTYFAIYTISGAAGESPAGGGLYDYQFTLPTPLALKGSTTYWIRILAGQTGMPDWGVQAGTGGDGTHFQFSTGLARFWQGSNDEAFTLRGTYAVPEPASIVGLLLGIATAVRRRVKARPAMRR